MKNDVQVKLIMKQTQYLHMNCFPLQRKPKKKSLSYKDSEVVNSTPRHARICIPDIPV